MDRGAWQATFHEVAKESDTTEHIHAQVTQWVKNTPASRKCRRAGFNPWVRKIPWRRAWQLTPVFLPGELQGQRSLVGYSLQVCKKSDMSETTEKHKYVYMYMCVCIYIYVFQDSLFKYNYIMSLEIKHIPLTFFHSCG